MELLEERSTGADTLVLVGGLDRSSDGGQTWETGLSLPGVDGHPVALAVDKEAIWLVTGEPRPLPEHR